MKTKLLLGAVLLISSLCAAQDVKVKKGEIMLDNKSVAKMEQKGRVYYISDMNNKLLFEAIITNETPSGLSDLSSASISVTVLVVNY